MGYAAACRRHHGDEVTVRERAVAVANPLKDFLKDVELVEA